MCGMIFVSHDLWMLSNLLCLNEKLNVDEEGEKQIIGVKKS